MVLLVLGQEDGRIGKTEEEMVSPVIGVTDSRRERGEGRPIHLTKKTLKHFHRSFT